MYISFRRKLNILKELVINLFTLLITMTLIYSLKVLIYLVCLSPLFLVLFLFAPWGVHISVLIYLLLVPVVFIIRRGWRGFDI